MEKPPIESFVGASDHSMRDGILHYLQLNWETGIELLVLVLLVLFLCSPSKNNQKEKD